MKRQSICFFAMLLTFGAAMMYEADCKAAETTISTLQQAALDYSDKTNWMLFNGSQSVGHAVDLFYLYPTSVPAKCTADIGEVEEGMKHQAMLNYLKGASCMESFTNVYAPYYRQLSGAGISKAKKADNLEKMCRESVVRTDVFAALDYYFKNQNNGKPFILAGHSQGSCLLKIVLAEYMKAHPEYMKRMIACYAIGFYFPDSWFKANPHVKKAAGETDTGVLISWNTETAGAMKGNICVEDGSFTINPLNWKTDETPAGIEKNLGSVEVDRTTLKKTSVKGKVNAKIDLKRGALVCEGAAKPLPPNPLFGDNSFHFDDWAFFYENVRENAQKRIQAYFENNK